MAGRAVAGNDRRAGNRQPWRDVLHHPGEQRGSVRRNARRGWETRSDRRRAACRSRSAACRWWCRAWHRPQPSIAAENTTRPCSCSRDERVGPGRIVGREARAGDGDQPSAFGKTCQRGGDVAKCRIRHAAIDIRHRREGRVHQHDARHDAGIEMIVDVRGVEAGDVATPGKR